MNLLTTTPTKTIVTVYFKPKNVPPYNASEIREVEFTVNKDFTKINRTKVFDLAKEQIVQKNIIEKQALQNYWEPYKLTVDVPEPPKETAEFIGVG